MVSALGDSEIDLSAFEMQLEVILSSMQLGRIPLYYDEVVIGSADTLRLSSKAHVYIIGANLGEFPKSFKESSYFSDKDKEKLASLGLNVTPDREKGYARELFAFSRAFASGEKTVTITAPDRNSAFEDSSPSEIFARIEEITDKAISARYISTLPLEIYPID